MEFEPTETQRMLVETAREIVEGFGESYFREKRLANEAPTEYLDAVADAGFFGIPFPEAFGGEGMGMLEVVFAIEALGRAGAWSPLLPFTENVAIGGQILLKHGTDEQKRTYIPRIVDDDMSWAIGVTEPNTGTNMLRTSTFARREGDEFVVSGEKIFNSGLDAADRYVLLTRTKRFEDVDDRRDGLTVFLVDPGEPAIEYAPIDINVHWPLGQQTYTVHIDDLRVHESQICGGLHDGAEVIWSALTPERITTGMAHVARGWWALDRAVDYATTREVWGEPIGAHQGVQHPLARAHADLLTASTMVKRAANAYDSEATNTSELANVAHLQAGDAAFDAADAAMETFGGSSVAAEEGLAAVWGLLRHQRIAPLPDNMKLNYLAHNVLDLPRSYGT